MTTAPSSTRQENAPGAHTPSAATPVAASPSPAKGGGTLERGIDELLADLNTQVAANPASEPAPGAPIAPAQGQAAIRAIPKAAKVIPGDPLPERPVSGEEALDASIDQAVKEATARMPAPSDTRSAAAATTTTARTASSQAKSPEATRSPAVVAASNVGELDAALAQAPVSMESPPPLRGPAAAMPPLPVAPGIIIGGGDEILTGVIVDKSKPPADETPANKAARENKEKAAAPPPPPPASPEATRTAKAPAPTERPVSPADSREATALPPQPSGRLWRALSIFGVPLLKFSPNARDLLGWFALITLFQAFVVWLLVITAR